MKYNQRHISREADIQTHGCVSIGYTVFSFLSKFANMIAFNFNIVFPDEPYLQDDKYNPALETIRVLAANKSILQTPLNTTSDWMDMSGRKAKYRAQRDFSKSTETGSPWALEIEGPWKLNTLVLYTGPSVAISYTTSLTLNLLPNCYASGYVIPYYR